MIMLKPLSRREENRIGRKAGIIAIARASFLERGYAATAMSTIAAELGGSKGTLWAHFPSKEALFAAVLDDVTAAFRAELEDALRPGRSIEETLVAFCERFLTKLASPAALSLHRLIVGEAGRFPEVGAMFFERGPAPVIRQLSHYLSGEMESGRLRRTEPAEAARHLIALANAPQQPCLWNVRPALTAGEISAHAESAVQVFLRGYASA